MPILVNIFQLAYPRYYQRYLEAPVHCKGQSQVAEIVCTAKNSIETTPRQQSIDVRLRYFLLFKCYKYLKYYFRYGYSVLGHTHD